MTYLKFLEAGRPLVLNHQNQGIAKQAINPHPLVRPAEYEWFLSLHGHVHGSDENGDGTG